MGSLNFKHTAKIMFVLLAMAVAGCSHAKPNRTDQMFKGKLASELAHTVADGNVNTAKSLIAQGADVNAVDEEGRSLLELAIYANQPKAFELLLDDGANISYNGPGSNSTVMHFAAEMTDRPIFLKMLLQHGAPVDIVGNAGMTPLFSSLLGDSTNNLETLIKHGADVNHIASMGDTPLIDAAITNSYNAILILLENGANPSAANKQGKTFQAYLDIRPKDAYTRQAQEFKEEIRRYLTAHHVKVTF